VPETVIAQVTGSVVAAAARVVDAIVAHPAPSVGPVVFATDVMSRIVRTLASLRDGRDRYRCDSGERQECLGVTRGHGALPFNWQFDATMVRLGRS
jgi:hypothetical protein